MIICDNSNIDIIQGVIGYGNDTEGITDWRIQNTSTGVFNILNNTSETARLSIIDNGNIGIRTTPSISSSKFYIDGYVYCQGIYKKNNRDIINDTSNYVLSASNILVSHILTNTKNVWETTTNNMIYYNTSNVGIGTTNPISKLHVYDDTTNATTLTIQNNNVPVVAAAEIISSPAADEKGTINGSIDKYMIFKQTGINYTITVPTDGITCDILIVGGGGGGGFGGGGGAGGLIYLSNIPLSVRNYNINVGKGGIGPPTYSDYVGTNGDNSSFDIYIAIGGGYGGNGNIDGNNGGSGGGGDSYSDDGRSTSDPGYGTSGQGNMGGYPDDYGSGGGGGAGGSGGSYDNPVGGIGLQYSIDGTLKYYAGGGGGSLNSSGIKLGGLGGGGGLGRMSGEPNTGGGGGGCDGTGGYDGRGGAGGSGIVIIRYRKLTSASSIIELNIEPTIPEPTVVEIPGTLYKYILFPYTITTSGQYTFTTTEDINCEILVVGGGGGGGGSIGGGGGAGAVVYIPSGTLSTGSYTISVGNGGIGSTGGASANGVLSSLSGSFGTITAEGGGGVTGGHDSGDGNIGGSGGGAAGPNSVLNYGGAAGTSSSLGGFTGFIYGNRGGNNTATRTGNPTNASGGGGAGSAAPDTDPNLTAAGNGGAGILINITGNNVYYGGGGGGAAHVSTGGSGGIGGGGDGARENMVGYSGAPNTGGGGGGGGWAGYSGGSGGSGVVIIRYLNTKNLYLITKNLTKDYKIGNYNGDFIVKSSINSTDNDNIKITGSTGSITNPTGTTTWTTASDRRIKENIERASYDKCYESINKLELNRFNYINGFNTINRDITQLGFIAQEVKEIFPKSVFENSYINNNINISDLHSIDITQINYTLYGAVKKLIEIINDDEEKIKKLERILKIDIDNTLTSNLILDTVLTSNIDISSTSNIDIDKMLTSNIDIDSISIITE